MYQLRTFVFALLVMILSSIAGFADQGDIYAEIMATPVATAFGPGHALICISQERDAGVQKEYYGFYPSSKSGEVIVGSPGLTGQFKKSPVRFSHITWSLKRKITDEQRQAFTTLVDKVNAGEYHLSTNNCGAFLHDAVDAFGWTNVAKSLSPEPFVRELYIANIKEFRYVGSAGTDFKFVRDGTSWTGYKDGVNYATLRETGHNATWIFLRWEAKKTSLRLPVKGGRYEFRVGTGKDAWYSGRPVTPITDIPAGSF